MGMNTKDMARAVAEGLVRAKEQGRKHPSDIIDEIAERMRLAPSGRRRFVSEARKALATIQWHGWIYADVQLKKAMGEE